MSEARRTVKFLTAIKRLHASSLQNNLGLISYQMARGYLKCNDLVSASSYLRDALQSKLSAVIWLKALLTLTQLKLKLLFNHLT